jgi:hypothetical protein
MKLKDFKYCIVVNGDNKPMSFSQSDEQFCFADNEIWEDELFPLKIVTIKTARKQIEISTQNRKKWGFDKTHPTTYRIMPVLLTQKHKG